MCFLTLCHLLNPLLAFRNIKTSIYKKATLYITAIIPLANRFTAISIKVSKLS